MVFSILGDVMVRSIIKIFSNNLLIDIPFSLIIIRLNLISSFFERSRTDRVFVYKILFRAMRIKVIYKYNLFYNNFILANIFYNSSFSNIYL